MIDRIFAPVLTFIMLIAGTATIASGLFNTPRADVVVAAQSVPAQPIVLETVVITAKRAHHTHKSASAVALTPAEGRGVLLHGARD
jgi:hypothetical protein